MKVSRKVREEAILICAIGASTLDLSSCYWTITQHLDACDDADELAFSAWLYIYERRWTLEHKVIDAEAECLLREGWTR